MDPITSSYRRASKVAVNLEDIRDFLYHLEHSSILRYFILNQYKTKMMMEATPILREIEAYEKKQKK